MRQSSFFFASLLCLASLVSANPITYDVTINTSSISGAAGALDFNFNPGPLVTQSASLRILNFTSNGTPVGSPTLSGDVNGGLPATVTFDNGSGFNDYFGGFTYGSTISFMASLSGPALSSPDGVSTSGSTFAFSMFSDMAGTVPILTTDITNGFAFTVDVNLDGTTTLTDSSLQTYITEFGGTTGTPEPGTSSLVLLCVVVAWISWVLRKRARHA
jgi:hypothetical protein